MRISKNTFIKNNVFKANECKAMGEYFEEMDLNGWMLKDIVPGFLVFKKSKPEKCYFKVDIFPERGREEYIEYCESAGWEYVTGDSKYIMFSSKNKNTIQIDEEMLLKKVRKSLLFNILSSIVLIAIIIFNIFGSQNNPYVFLGNISSNHLLFSFTIIAIVMIYRIIEILIDIRWYFKSNISLKSDESISYPTLNKLKTRMIFEKLFMYMLTLIVISWISVIDSYVFISIAVFLSGILLAKIISLSLNKYNKIIPIMVCILGIVIATYITFIGDNTTEVTNKDTYITINDFSDIEIDKDRLYIESSNSFLASYYNYSYEKGSNKLDYQILKSKYDWILDKA